MPRQSLKRRPDGRYACRYQNKWFYGETQSEALAEREAYKRMLESGLNMEAKGISVERYAKQWAVTYKSHLTTGPYNTCVRILNRFCDHESIGARPIKDITPSEVQSFFNTYAGKSHSTICDVRDTIRGLFKGALADRVIQYDPTLGIKLPKGTKGTHRAIEQWERELINQTAHRLRSAVMTMLYAGLRRGEVLAINIDRDVDYERKTLTVREAVRFESQHLPTVVDPKTEAGSRTVPLLDVLADELRGNHGLLCPRTDGGFMTEQAWKRAWESYLVALEQTANGSSKRWYGKTKEDKARAAAGEALPPWKTVSIRPHDLRHSYCTMLYDAGVDLKTAQKWMGHADQEMTLRIYTHLTEAREKAASEALENTAKMLSSSQIGSQINSTIHPAVDI